jgi:cytosine/adenosine deaminase-related metal-dependent hydrolase
MLDLAIRGGDVVAPHGTGRWNVGVKDGKIAFVGVEDHAVKASKVIDATGKLVVPGGIEPHTHLGDRITMQPSEAGLFALGPEEDTRYGVWGHDHARRLRLGASPKRCDMRDRASDESLE